MIKIIEGYFGKAEKFLNYYIVPTYDGYNIYDNHKQLEDEGYESIESAKDYIISLEAKNSDYDAVRIETNRYGLCYLLHPIKSTLFKAFKLYVDYIRTGNLEDKYYFEDFCNINKVKSLSDEEENLKEKFFNNNTMIAIIIDIDTDTTYAVNVLEDYYD